MAELKNNPTLLHMLVDVHQDYRVNPAFIYRAAGEEFTITYEKWYDDILLLSRAFESKKIKKGTKVMFLCDNRYEWIVTDFALVALGAVSVPRGSDTPTQELEFILDHSGAEFIILENEELLSQHEEMLKTKKLKGIFIVEAGAKHTLFDSIWSYQDLLKDRTITPADLKTFADRRKELTSDDTFTIIYTSGTTGTPKGVVLTHQNIMYNVNLLPTMINLTEEDVWVSILPSWHIYERAAEYVALSHGTCIVYSSIKTFSQDLEIYRPTIVATVPRLWESMYAKVNAALEKQGKEKIFNKLVSISTTFRFHGRRMKNHLPVFAQKNLLVRGFEYVQSATIVALLFPLYRFAMKKFAGVQAKFGGRLRLAVSGGGSLPKHIEEWIDAVGIRVVNAYGMTECAPLIAGRGLGCDIFATLGWPGIDTDLKIVNEAGETLPAGEEGEILVRGSQVMPGYYNNDEENKKSFTEDGFFRTGDLGKLTVTGELVITGRSKEIIVLASGENIDPSRIESAITKLPFVSDAVLVGQDKKGLGALIVPDMDKLKEFVMEKFDKLHHEAEEMLASSELVEKVKREINKILNKKAGFKPYEKLFNIHFLEKEFKMGEELTNTLKKKRHVIEKKYQDIIAKLFKKEDEK